jgi:hypothetical protein
MNAGDIPYTFLDIIICIYEVLNIILIARWNAGDIPVMYAKENTKELPE